MNRRKRIRIIISVLLFPICIILWLVFTLLRNGFDISRNPLPEYNNLFTKEIQSELQTPYVYKSKIKEAESNYNLPDDFHLTVCKLDLKLDKPISQILKIQGDPSRSYEPYASYAEDAWLKMTRTTDKIDPVSSVNFRYQGELTKALMKSDTLIYFYLKFKKFSISYDDDPDNDIWGESQGKNDARICLAFIKKQKSLFLIMLFKTKKEDQDFPPNLLYSYIRK